MLNNQRVSGMFSQSHPHGSTGISSCCGSSDGGLVVSAGDMEVLSLNSIFILCRQDLWSCKLNDWTSSSRQDLWICKLSDLTSSTFLNNLKIFKGILQVGPKLAGEEATLWGRATEGTGWAGADESWGGTRNFGISGVWEGNQLRDHWKVRIWNVMECVYATGDYHSLSHFSLRPSGMLERIGAKPRVFANINAEVSVHSTCNISEPTWNHIYKW